MDWAAAANEVLKWGVIGTPLVYFGYKAIKGLREDWPEAKRRHTNKTVDGKNKQIHSLFL